MIETLLELVDRAVFNATRLLENPAGGTWLETLLTAAALIAVAVMVLWPTLRPASTVAMRTWQAGPVGFG